MIDTVVPVAGPPAYVSRDMGSSGPMELAMVPWQAPAEAPNPSPRAWTKQERQHLEELHRYIKAMLKLGGDPRPLSDELVAAGRVVGAQGRVPQ